jgi:hypothetical protein
VAGFVPGRELAAAYYAEVVAPLLRGVAHSAALVGYGSDVLGFDDERSTDHGWGPRVTVFVGAEAADDVEAAVSRALPETFRGLPTRYGWDAVPVQHHVRVVTVGAWLEGHLGFDPRGGVSTVDWLTTPQQLLLEVVGGPVFHDGLGELEPLRRTLAWYPRDVWLWLLACQWRRIAQEEPFAGRAAEVGDELGSRLIAARLARDAIRLAFLLERTYAPYTKWLGSAFARLDAAREVGPALERMVGADRFARREDAWVEAVEALARRHGELDVTARVDPSVRGFHSRPFRVIDADRFVDACLAALTDSWLRELPLVGSIDQACDSTDVLSDAAIARRARSLYAAEAQASRHG